MKDVRKITTDEVREAYHGLLIQTGERTYELIDEETAGTEFDLWLVTERKRVAEMAIKKERARILAILEAAICDCDGDCMRIDTTFDELQTKIEEL